MGSPAPSESRRPPRVLIGYDGSEGSRRAIAAAAVLLPGHEAIVATAWMALPDAAPNLMLAPGGVVLAAASALGDVLQERAEETAAEGVRLAIEAGLPAEQRVIRSTDAHWEALVRCADECDADLVVVGSRGRSTIAAAVLGSVSTGVLHHTSRPVLVIPHRDEP